MIIFRTKRIIMISDLNIVILQSDSLPLSVCYLNQKMKQNHEQTFWEMIVEKATCDKK